MVDGVLVGCELDAVRTRGCRDPLVPDDLFEIGLCAVHDELATGGETVTLTIEHDGLGRLFDRAQIPGQLTIDDQLDHA